MNSGFLRSNNVQIVPNLEEYDRIVELGVVITLCIPRQSMDIFSSSSRDISLGFLRA